MKRQNQRITSREYKLILNADRFQNFERGEKAFWHITKFLIEKNGGSIIKRQDKVKMRKTCISIRLTQRYVGMVG